MVCTTYADVKWKEAQVVVQKKIDAAFKATVEL